ncbi:MAG TPA: pitrilysin family protein [Gemmatimonadaceae bacterium]|jgi:zinc protease
MSLAAVSETGGAPRRPVRPWVRLAVSAAAALGTLLVAPRAPASAQQTTLERITHERTLANGLQVIVVENHAVPLATVEVVVKTGAMAQDSSDQGVPHLFEHMLFTGYRALNDETFAQQASELHASYNGTTSEERVTYYLTVPSTNVDRAVAMLATLVREPRFAVDELNRERFVVLNEMGRDLSDPREHLEREVDFNLWGTGWPRKNTLGETVALLAASPSHLTEIFHRYYVPNNAALVVTGDVNTAKVFEWAQSRFGGWKRTPDPYVAHPVPPMPKLDSVRSLVVIGDVSDVTVEVAWQGPSVTVNRGDTYSADVLSQMLSDEQSEFQKRLVESGLFQSADLGYETLAHVGPIHFFGTTTLPNLAAALTVLQAEVTQMGSADYFEPEELRIAAKQRRVAQSFDLELAAAMASEYADWWASAGLDYYMSYGDSLSTRTPADLAQFAQRYLSGRPYVIGVLAKQADAPSIARMLQQYVAMTEEK